MSNFGSITLLTNGHIAVDARTLAFKVMMKWGKSNMVNWLWNINVNYTYWSVAAQQDSYDFDVRIMPL